MGDDGGDTVRNDDFPVDILPDVTAVVQKVLNAVIGQLAALRVPYALLVEPVPNLLHGGSLVIALERLPDKGGGKGVGLEGLVAVDLVADGEGAAVEFALQGVFRHATHHLFGQVGGVVFGVALQHGFQNDTLGPVGNDFGSGHHLDTVLLQQGLVPGAVVAVAGKPVQLPYDNHIEQALAAVSYHVLKLRAVVGLGGEGPVDVVPQDGDFVLFSVFAALPNLPLNALLPLVVAGISRVNDGFHCHTLLSVKRWAVLPPQRWGAPLVTYYRKFPDGQGPAEPVHFSLDGPGISDKLHGRGCPSVFQNLTMLAHIIQRNAAFSIRFRQFSEHSINRRKFVKKAAHIWSGFFGPVADYTNISRLTRHILRKRGENATISADREKISSNKSNGQATIKKENRRAQSRVERRRSS